MDFNSLLIIDFELDLTRYLWFNLSSRRKYEKTYFELWELDELMIINL